MNKIWSFIIFCFKNAFTVVHNGFSGGIPVQLTAKETTIGWSTVIVVLVSVILIIFLIFKLSGKK